MSQPNLFPVGKMGMIINRDLAELVLGQNELTLEGIGTHSVYSVTISHLQYLQCFLHSAFEEVCAKASHGPSDRSSWSWSTNTSWSMPDTLATEAGEESEHDSG